MFLFFLAPIVLCQEYIVDDTRDCLDATNTTVPSTTCTIARCHCHLCYKPSNLSESFCLFATNVTMSVDNTTWLCPGFSNSTLASCKTAQSTATIIIWFIIAPMALAVLLMALRWLYRYCRNQGYISM